jgi:hypothetical protein
VRPKSIQPFFQLRSQLLIRRPVRFPTSPHQKVPCLTPIPEARQDYTAQDLTQASLEPVPLHDRVSVPRHDETGSRIQRGGSRVEDVQVARPAPLPPLKQRTDLAAPRDPPRSWQTLLPATSIRCRSHQRLDRYFELFETAKRLRPLRLRRFSTSRPARVLMRARNPCLFKRFRRRGRYVGLPIKLPQDPVFASCKAKYYSAIAVKRSRISGAWTRAGATPPRRFTRPQAPFGIVSPHLTVDLSTGGI